MTDFEGFEKQTERCDRSFTSLPEEKAFRLAGQRYLSFINCIPRGPSTVTSLDLMLTLTVKLSASSLAITIKIIRAALWANRVCQHVVLGLRVQLTIVGNAQLLLRMDVPHGSGGLSILCGLKSVTLEIATPPVRGGSTGARLIENALVLKRYISK